MKAPHWHDDLDAEYVGPSTLAPEVEIIHYGGELRPAVRGIEPYRDAHRALVRAMYEAHLLRRQKLFAVRHLHTRELVDPLGPIDFRDYFPIVRPTLPELLSSYAFHLRLRPDQVLDFGDGKIAADPT